MDVGLVTPDGKAGEDKNIQPRRSSGEVKGPIASGGIGQQGQGDKQSNAKQAREAKPREAQPREAKAKAEVKREAKKPRIAPR